MNKIELNWKSTKHSVDRHQLWLFQGKPGDAQQVTQGIPLTIHPVPVAQSFQEYVHEEVMQHLPEDICRMSHWET